MGRRTFIHDADHAGLSSGVSMLDEPRPETPRTIYILSALVSHIIADAG
jgi:hypothetical protein